VNSGESYCDAVITKVIFFSLLISVWADRFILCVSDGAYLLLVRANEYVHIRICDAPGSKKDAL